MWRSWHILGGGAGGARPLSDMESTEVADHAAAFTEALLGAGHMLCGLAADLAEAIPPEAYPGEESGAVVIDMIVGQTEATAAADRAEALVKDQAATEGSSSSTNGKQR